MPKRESVFQNYVLLIAMLGAIAAGCAVGWAWPGATALEPLGTIFINLLFCIVVPLVFCSVAGAIANMKSRGPGRSWASPSPPSSSRGPSPPSS